MPVLRINEFPEGSGSLSNDDILLFMDDPSGSGITKKISLSQISSAIGGGGGGSLSIEQRYFDYVQDVGLYGTVDLVAVTDINDDDNEYLIELPFSVTFLGQSYNEVWLNSNSYLTFLSMDANSPAGYSVYWPQGPANLGVPAIVAGAADRNITNYYYGATNDGRFVIRYEGKAINWGGDSNVTATRIWEIWFYENEPEKISLVVSEDMPQGGVWGMHDGVKWIDIYEQLPRLNQNTDWESLINSVDIYTKESSNANTLKFIGQGVETYIEGNKAFVEVNPLQGMLNVDLDGDGNTTISSAGYGLILKSNHNDSISLASNGDINITAKTRDNDNPGNGYDVYVNGGVATGDNNNGGSIYIQAGDKTGDGSEGSIYLMCPNSSSQFQFTNNGLPRLIFPNGTTIAQGTFDNGNGGNYGISLNCYVGYELNWQGGHLKSTADNGVSASNIWCDSAIEFQGTGIDNVQIDNIGLTFSDGTTQITAPSVIDISAGQGISVSSSSGIYTINSSGEASVVKTTVFNKTGSQIPKFSVVYINGGQGDQPTVDLAIASGELTSSKTYGITAETIDHMSLGDVTVMGALTGLDTDQFNPTAPTGNVNGTSLWLSPTVAGGVTTTKPSAPNHAVYVGTIVRTHQNEGIVEVRIQNGYEIQELHNVAISGVANNDVLVYNSGTSLWQNNGMVVFSNPSGISGASAITNIVQISQNDYDNLPSYDLNTVYIINT